MSATALRRALGIFCGAGFGFSAALLLARSVRTSPHERDKRLLRSTLDALGAALPHARLTVTARAGRVLVSGPASAGDEARVEGCLRGLGVCAMQLSINEQAC